MKIETHCFAWENGAVCKDVCDFFYPISVLEQHKILDVCKRISIDGITTIATDIVIPTISFVANSLGLVSIPEKVALSATHKWNMKQRFFESGVPSPICILARQYDETLFQDLRFPVIVKPVDRSGSRGINLVYGMEGLEDAVNKALEESLSRAALVEEYVKGREVSVESISWKGKHYILAVTDKVTTGAPHFVELAHHQPSSLSAEILVKVRDMTKKALEALGITEGASHTELMIGEDGGIHVIEVGARMGGDFIGSHLVPLSTGYDFLKGVIEIALNTFETPVIEHQNYAGVYFLCKETERIRPYLEKKNEFDVYKEIRNLELVNVTNSNDRSGFLIYKAQKRIDL